MTETTPKQNFFLDLIVAFLAPMFLAVTGGNVHYARAAAIETVNAYRAEHHVDLLAVAKIIAFGIAALGSLSLAMADDLSVSMILRLRGNAVSADRAGERCSRALQQSRTASRSGTDHDDAVPDEASIIAQAEQRAQQTGPAELPTMMAPEAASATNRNDLAWANAMVDAAAELTASIPHLPPHERPDASIRAKALSNVASEILAGKAPQLPPRLSTA